MKTYEAIVKGENVTQPGVPESFHVLMKELQSLGMSVELMQERASQFMLDDYDEDMGTLEEFPSALGMDEMFSDVPPLLGGDDSEVGFAEVSEESAPTGTVENGTAENGMDAAPVAEDAEPSSEGESSTEETSTEAAPQVGDD